MCFFAENELIFNVSSYEKNVRRESSATLQKWMWNVQKWIPAPENFPTITTPSLTITGDTFFIDTFFIG